jgi:hypothetical protein
MANCLVEVETCVRLGGMQPAGGLIAIVALVCAVVSILRSQDHGVAAGSAWMAAEVILPIVGPLFWFAIGKRYPYGLDGNVGRDADDYLGV